MKRLHANTAFENVSRKNSKNSVCNWGFYYQTERFICYWYWRLLKWSCFFIGLWF